MASGSESGKSVDSNKENNNMDKEGTVGIEANDLATLLNRFEEATSSDDINVPRPVHKAKWNIMKFKSAGNSPAATPPATPPPSGPILMKTFTTQPSPGAVRSQTLPIRLTVVNPIPTLAQRSTLPSASSTRLSSAPSQPKINIQISKPGLSSAFLVNGQSLLTKSSTTSSIVAQNPAFGPSLTSTISSSPSQLQRQIIKVPFHSGSMKSSVVSSSLHSGASNIAPNTTKTFNVLRMPALDAASSFSMESSSIKQIIPKKRSSSLMPNAIEMGKKKKLDASSISSSVSLSTSSVPLSLKLTQSTKSAPLSSNLPFKEESPHLNFKQGQAVSSYPNTNSLNITVGGKGVGSGQNGISKTLRPQVQKDEHSYCWSGPCFNNKNTSGVGLSTSVSVLQPSEAIAEDSSSPVCESNLQEREVVLEEGVMFVDSNGNDLCSKLTEEELNHQSKEQMCSQPFEADNSNRIVSFEAAGENANRRARKYRKRGELRNSPVKEDKSDFYDKIPSHYTALSIPTKQIRKTVFESVSSTLGSQDHLALSTEFEVKEEDESQYNKVPMHHRIFTNTSHELSNENESSFSYTEEDKEERPSRQRRISSTSRHSAHSTSSHRSYRSGSRHSNRSGSRHSRRDLSSRSRSRSPTGSDYSQTDARRSRPLTRRRRRNSSSQQSASSVSSSCSSNSYCSTCGASLSSRSRSRSFSSDGSRERSFSPQSRYSRSRSRSPRERGGRRRRMSNRSPTPERSNYRSWSRSQSPPVRRRRNSYRTSSRSRRHQLKERSSTERKIMELRKQREEDKVKAMEERRVLYVGKLPDNFSKHQLRKRFECFGEIKGVRLNFRVHGDNYGFVTFTHASDAFAAKEKGNSLPDQPKFDLCFGGRRRFCPDKYADLDGNREIEEEYAPMQSSSKPSGELDYAALLKQHVSAQKKGKR